VAQIADVREELAVTALLKLTLVLAGIIVLLSRQWNLGFVLILASLVIGLAFAHPPQEILRDALLTTIDPLTLLLTLIVTLIMVMGELLRETASLEEMVESLQTLNPDGHIVIASLPALIGLLPMVGGAMFSAPMVEEVGNQLDVSKARKTFVNYWFRHVWEPIFPLYPSLMVGAALLDLTPTQLSRATWPITIAAIVGGVFFGLLRLPRQKDINPAPASSLSSLRTLAASIWPIVLVIVLSLILPFDDRLSLILSLLVTITLIMVTNRIPARRLVPILRERIPWKTISVIFGALIFRRVLENSGAVIAVSESLIQLHIPLMVLAFAVPGIAGLLTGLMVAGYSIGFPIIVPLLVADGGGIPLKWAAWLTAGGYLGTMCSPVHLCLALTRAYFQAEWGTVYKRLIPAALLVAATVGAVFLLST
jgi:integral membrane protein (TIGR00529 family)